MYIYIYIYTYIYIHIYISLDTSNYIPSSMAAIIPCPLSYKTTKASRPRPWLPQCLLRLVGTEPATETKMVHRGTRQPAAIPLAIAGPHLELKWTQGKRHSQFPDDFVNSYACTSHYSWYIFKNHKIYLYFQMDTWYAIPVAEGDLL